MNDITTRILCRNANDIAVVNEIVVENIYLKEFLLPFLKHPGLVIDIGAHIGAFTVLALSQLDTLGAVAVEPENANYSQLQENLEQFGLTSKVIAVSCGLWDIDCEIPLYLVRENAVAHTPFLEMNRAEGSSSSEFQMIKMRTLDGVLHEAQLDEKPIMLIKSNCEGAECRLFKAAKRTLSNTAVIIGSVHEHACTPADVQNELSGFAVVIGEQRGVQGAEVRNFWAVNKRFWSTQHEDMETFLLKAKELDLKQKLIQIEYELAKTKQELSQRGLELSELKSSLSWRITAPFRFLLSAVKQR
jgi:FkbM family methyltransferase